MKLLPLLIFFTGFFNAVFGQKIEVLSVNDGSYPEIMVRVKLYNATGDTFSVSEQDTDTDCRVEETANPSSGERMFVFLAENSYFFYQHKIFDEIKKTLSELGHILPENSNMNILYFGQKGKTVKYLSAAQTTDFALLAGNTEDYFTPQKDSLYIENKVYEAIEEAVKYTSKHSQNNAVILTVITRALNLSQVKTFSKGFLENLKNSGIYLNVIMYETESFNAKHELENIAAATGGNCCFFNDKDLEAKLAQVIEKSAKVKAKFPFREYSVKFTAKQKGISNSFIIKYGSLQALCEYSNPNTNVIWRRYPVTVAVVVSLLLILTAAVMYYKTRHKIIRRIDVSTQTHIREIQKENKALKRELEKYRKQPVSVLKNFEKFDIEQNLVGPGKIIPRLLVQDGDKKMVFELSKMIITIGRKETNDIVIENRTVSSNHAALSFEGGLFYITDNNSTNGTFINDMRITKGKICPDDIVRIGAVFAKINY